MIIYYQDGNLVLYNTFSGVKNAVWSIGTHSNPTTLTMQTNGNRNDMMRIMKTSTLIASIGNLVASSSTGGAYWEPSASIIWGGPYSGQGVYLKLQANG